MRILHIATAFRRSRTDIITPWLEELLACQAKKHDVAVFTSGYAYTKRRQKYRNIKIARFSYAPKNMMRLTHDFTIQDYIKANRKAVFLLPLFIISASVQFFEFALKFKPDLVVVHWPVPLSLIPLPSWSFLKTKKMFVYYGAELKLLESLPAPLRKAMTLILNGADAAAAISNDTGKAAERAGVKGKIDIIPYGIKLSTEEKAEKEKFIMFAGRLVERKGVKFLIKAMKTVDENYRLVIVGNGPLMNELKKYADEAGVTGRVDFRGFVPEWDKIDLYRRAKIFVLPAVHDSRGETEGLGMVIVEAMSCYTPAVATGTGGITDIVNDGFNGLLSNEGDARDIAAKVNMLIKDNEMYSRMQINARRTAESKFAVERISEMYERAYEKI